LDPRISHPQHDETPEVTLGRTRALLARSRATLDAATKRLSHHDDEGRLFAPPASEPSSDTRPMYD
jgi:hypothetical protein